MAKKPTKTRRKKAAKKAAVPTAPVSHRRLQRILVQALIRGGRVLPPELVGAEYTEKYTEHYSEQYSEQYTETYTDKTSIIRPDIDVIQPVGRAR